MSILIPETEITKIGERIRLVLTKPKRNFLLIQSYLLHIGYLSLNSNLDCLILLITKSAGLNVFKTNAVGKVCEKFYTQPKDSFKG